MKFTNLVLASLSVLFTSALALPVRDITDLGTVVAREHTLAIDTRNDLDDLEERDSDEEELWEVGIYARGGKLVSSSTKANKAKCLSECYSRFAGTEHLNLCLKSCCTFFFSSRSC